ncbi:MAG: hypothetical protein Q8876_07280 [Bacillota bacterium]|nr:hypothetical protein [Bacillota bacterium]
MTLNEKSAYLQGLSDGLKLDEGKDEVKVIKAIIDLLNDVTSTVTELDGIYDELSEQIDAVDKDLATLEDDFDDFVEECDDEDCDCCHCDDEDEDEVFYEVTCPTCGETVCLDEETLLCGEIDCPNCGEFLEFDFDNIDDNVIEEIEMIKE